MTVTDRVAVWPSRVPVMVAVPGATAVTWPVRLTVAMDGSLLLHWTLAVTSVLVPSL
ncbi:hypothetical protein D3C72_2523660 [compost metagenome]